MRAALISIAETPSPVAGKSLARYFPDLLASVRAIKAKQFVLDGEIVIPFDGSFSFEQLLQRIHPAKSRVLKLAAESPATLIVFDLLSEGATVLIDRPLVERRTRLEQFIELG